MLLDLDKIIFVFFLLLNLAVGIFYSRRTISIEDYAIGSRKFSTGTITSTVVATYIGAGVLSATLTESYRQGLYFIIPAISEPLTLMTIGYFLVPKMIGFFGSLSVAETMGKLYGKNVRIITGILGLLACLATVAMQYKVAASIMQIFFGIDSFYMLLLCACIVTTYSCLGGIKAVTFTDILQFCTFGTIIPLICISIWKTSSLNIEQLFQSLSHNPAFDYKEVLNVDNPRFLPLLFLFLFFTIPDLDPAIVQRVNMSSGVKQAQKSFITASAISLCIMLILSLTGIMILSNNPEVDPDNLLSYMVNTYTYTGLKGLTASGIMAILMSTSDSYINSATVLLNNDILKPLNLEPSKPQKKLSMLRLATLPMSAVAFIFALKTESVFDLLLKSYSFYMPVITVPLLLAIVGIRSNTKVALMGMASGLITVTLLLINESELNETVIGMLANLTVFMIGYFLNKKSYLSFQKCIDHLKLSCSKLVTYLIQKLKYLISSNFYETNFPKQESLYVLLGIFFLISTFLTSFTLPESVYGAYSFGFDVIIHVTLMFSFVMTTYPLWLSKFKQSKLSFIIFEVMVFWSLIIAPGALVVISNFNQSQVVLFLINIFLIALIIKWQMSIVVLIASVCIGIKCNNLYFIDAILQFKIIFTLLILSGIIIALLKPKQEADAISEEKINHLAHKVEDQQEEIVNLSNTKKLFLRNLQHETNSPLTDVYSMSQALSDCYKKLSEEQRIAAIETIKTSSERLTSYVYNLVDISKLMTSKFKISKRTIQVSRLLEDTVEKCKRLYVTDQDEEDREIIFDIEPNITLYCDEYLIKRSFENLIINAIQYCKKGVIEINLHREQDSIVLNIIDSGIGIPQDELKDIFEPFTVSSKTSTPAGGRGLGLTFVKEAMALIRGSITVQSTENEGARFTMIISSV